MKNNAIEFNNLIKYQVNILNDIYFITLIKDLDGIYKVCGLDFNLKNLNNDFKLELENIEQKEEMDKVVLSLTKYLNGIEKELSFPIKIINGTDFEKEVWDELLKVKYGKSTSYKELANNINRPKAYRAVGNAVGNNPILIKIPCHRVLKFNNELGGFSGGINMKKKLLKIENINYKR